MPDYKAMYYKLFTAQTKTIELLQRAHLDTEELFISEGKQDDENAAQ